MISFEYLKKDEIKKFWIMLNLLDKETKNMLFEEDERIKRQSYESFFKNTNNSIENKDLIFVAKESNDIIGFISASRGIFNRIKHSAYIVIGIRKDFRGKKIGSNFFQELDRWAKNNNLKRLELTVMCKNKNAINLYKKNGFKIEGIKEKSMNVENKFEDEFYMAKIF